MHVVELDSSGARIDRALIYEAGDSVVPILEDFARRNKIRAGRFTALGAFRRATLAFFESESREYREIPVDEQVEVTALVGNIGIDGDDVVIHAHCVLGRPDGTAITGHLLNAEVRPTLELFLISYGGTLGRAHDDESGLALIRGGQEALE